MFFPEMDVNKYCFPFLFLLLFYLPGRAQESPDNPGITLPDTMMTTEGTLFLVEGRCPYYFSYNPAIFNRDTMIHWSPAVYPLRDILERICRLNGSLYTFIGKQVVFYMKGQEPRDVLDSLQEKAMIPVRRIRGRVIDSRSLKPLPYSTVWLPSTWEGTIANTDGYFLLNLSHRAAADSVAFSCMGYRTLRLPVKSLRDSMNLIPLKAAVIPIQEVVIRRTDPVYLLREAINRIPKNYARQPVIQTEFYRETIRKNGKYVGISEAVLQVYKPGYNSPSGDRARVLRGRKNQDYSEMDTLTVKIKAGLETTFLLDVIRNRPAFLHEEEFPRFNYQMSDILSIGDKSAYAIDFQQKENTELPHYRGRVYIDLESLAIRSVEFEIDPRTISRMAGSMVVRKPRKVRVRPLSAEYTVRYKEEGDLFYLSMIRAETRFRIRMTKKLFGHEFTTTSEMAVTGIETRDVSRFRFRDAVDPADIFTDALGGYDPTFWGPYNYLIPEESLEDALKRISRLMERQNEDNPGASYGQKGN